MKIGPRLATRCINLIFMHLRRKFSRRYPATWWNFSFMRNVNSRWNFSLMGY